MQGKSALSSVTIWGALAVVLVQLAELAGYSLSADDQAALTNLLQSGVAVVGSLVSIGGAGIAIWGRVRASKSITSMLPAGSAAPPAPSPPQF